MSVRVAGRALNADPRAVASGLAARDRCDAASAPGLVRDSPPALPRRGGRGRPGHPTGLGGAGHQPVVRVGAPDRRLRLLRDHDERALPGIVAGDRVRDRDVHPAREAPRDPGPALPRDRVRDHRARPPLPGPDGLRGGPEPVAPLSDVVDGRVLRGLPRLPRHRGGEHVHGALADPPDRLRALLDHRDHRPDHARRGLRGPRLSPVLARCLHAPGDGVGGAPVRHRPAGDRVLWRASVPPGRLRARRAARDPRHPAPPDDHPGGDRARRRLAGRVGALRRRPGPGRRDRGHPRGSPGPAVLGPPHRPGARGPARPPRAPPDPDARRPRRGRRAGDGRSLRRPGDLRLRRPGRPEHGGRGRGIRPLRGLHAVARRAQHRRRGARGARPGLYARRALPADGRAHRARDRSVLRVRERREP